MFLAVGGIEYDECKDEAKKLKFSITPEMNSKGLR